MGSNGAHSCDDDEIAMAIISGYKSKREKDGEIREIEGKKKEEEEENLYVGLHCTHKKKETGRERETTLLCYPLWIGFSLPTNSRRLVWAVELVPSSQEEKQVRERAASRVFLPPSTLSHTCCLPSSQLSCVCVCVCVALGQTNFHNMDSQF